MIYTVFLCAITAGHVDLDSCQMLQQSADLRECRLTIENQTRGVDLSHAATKLLCMSRSASEWQIAR
jgi:hypothetical protein